MEDYTEIQERLKAELDALVGRDDELRDAMRRKDPVGNLSFEDLGTEGEFDDVLDSLGDRSRTELLEIWNALQRIESKTFGNCGECGKKIGMERLKAMPATAYCIDCAAKMEAERGGVNRIPRL